VAAGPHVTAAGRRVTAFTQIEDRRSILGWVGLTYWLYRPSLGWERIVRRATQAQIDAAGRVPVLLKDDPALARLFPDAYTAADWGLVNRVVPDAQLDSMCAPNW